MNRYTIESGNTKLNSRCFDILIARTLACRVLIFNHIVHILQRFMLFCFQEAQTQIKSKFLVIAEEPASENINFIYDTIQQ